MGIATQAMKISKVTNEPPGNNHISHLGKGKIIDSKVTFDGITWQPLGPLLKVKLLVGYMRQIPRSTQRS